MVRETREQDTAPRKTLMEELIANLKRLLKKIGSHFVRKLNKIRVLVSSTSTSHQHQHLININMIQHNRNCEGVRIHR
jgi:hypothetical protein